MTVMPMSGSVVTSPKRVVPRALFVQLLSMLDSYPEAGLASIVAEPTAE